MATAGVEASNLRPTDYEAGPYEILPAHAQRADRAIPARSRRVARGDLEAWLQEAPDEWHTTGTFPGVEPVYRGPEGMRELWKFMRGPWEMRAEVERIEELDGAFLVLLTTYVKGSSSGAAVEWKAAHLVVFAGETTRLSNYLSWEDGLAAAGLDA